MEYYLLYYDLERNERTDDESVDLIYAVCLGDISDEVAEFFAYEYGTALGNQTSVMCEYFSFAKAGNKPLYVIRPSLSFDESVKFLCARAVVRFDQDNKNNPLNEVIIFMQRIAQVAKEYRERFSFRSMNIVGSNNTVAKLKEDATNEMQDKYPSAMPTTSCEMVSYSMFPALRQSNVEWLLILSMRFIKQGIKGNYRQSGRPE